MSWAHTARLALGSPRPSVEFEIENRTERAGHMYLLYAG
jgi:hypothetical protein